MAATESNPSGAKQGAGVQNQTNLPVPASENEVILTTPTPGQEIVVTVTPGEQIVVDFDLGDAILKATQTDLIIDLGRGTTITLQDFRTFAGGDQPPTVVLADGTLVAGDDLIFSLGSDNVEPAAGPEAMGSGIGEYRDDLGDILSGIGRLGPQDPGAIPTPAFEPPDDAGVLADIAAAGGPPFEPPGPPFEPPVEPPGPPVEPPGPPVEPPGPPVEPPGPPVEPPGPPVEPPPVENGPPLAIDDTVSLNIAEAVAVNNRGPGAGIYRVDLSEGGSGYQFLFNPGRPLDDLTFDSSGTLWGVGRSIDHLDLFTIDLLTQQVIRVATIDGVSTGQVSGIVFVGETLFALSGDTLYTVDPVTGQATIFQDNLGFQASTDLVELDGNLYFVSTSGLLVEIESDGSVNDLGALGLHPGPYGIVPGSMDGNDVLYLVSNSTGNPDFREVTIVDPGDGDFTLVGAFDLTNPQGEGAFQGLAGVAFDSDGLITGNVLTNDSDPDTDPLSVVSVSDGDENLAVPDGGGTLIHGEFGNLTLHSDGTYEYQLTSEQAGTDIFTYTISDGSGHTDSANLNFNVSGIFEQNLILGTDLGDNLAGTGGDDPILGYDGNDTLSGDDGNDYIFGGLGKDSISGGAGNDYLFGGSGNDIFVFSAQGKEGADVVHDFNVAEDTIRLTDVLDTDGVAGLSAADVDVAVSVSGDDVILTINASGPPPQQTTVTLEGINSGHAFDGDGTLQDLITSGLNVELSEDPS